MNADSSEQALLDGQVAEAEEWLQRRSNGASLCSPGCAGVAITSVKYAEGRWAALREVQRAVGEGAAPGTALAGVVDRWVEDLARRRSQGAGSDWIWYRAGGLDAMEKLAEMLTRGDG